MRRFFLKLPLTQPVRWGKWGQRVVPKERVQKWPTIISRLRASDYIIPNRVFIRNGGWETLLGGQHDDFWVGET